MPIMLAFILPLGCHRVDSRARVVSVSVRPMFSSSCFKKPLSRLSTTLLSYRFFIMQSNAKQPSVHASSDDDSPSVEATSSSSTTGLAVVEDESKASRSAAWGDTIMHVMLTALAITVSLQARRRVAAALLACLSVPQLLKLGHRLKLVPPSLYPLFPPPEAQNATRRALPAASEPVNSASSVSEEHLSSIQMTVDSLKETVSSRDLALATTLATLDSNLAAVRDAVQTLTPPAMPTAPFAHLAETQVLRARLARAEEARDAVQARLAASETARAESDHFARSANLSLDEARHTIADLRSRLASADVRLSRLPDIERRLDDALLRADTLVEQVRDLTQRCEELTGACKDAERRADRGDSIVSVLRSKIDGMTGVRTRSAEGNMSGGMKTQTVEEESPEKAEGWQKKLARTVAGLTTDSTILEEMKAMGESAGLADWPVGALSGGESEAPSRADGLPLDGGFAGGATIVKPEEVARLSSGQGEKAFSFSRNEFEMQRPQPPTDSQSSQSTSDTTSPEVPIIPPTTDNSVENANPKEYSLDTAEPMKDNDVQKTSDSESKYETTVDVSLRDSSPSNVQGLAEENEEEILMDSSTSVAEPTVNKVPEETSMDTEAASIDDGHKPEQISYLQQLERQSRKPQDLQEPEPEDKDAEGEPEISNADNDSNTIPEENSSYEAVAIQDEVHPDGNFGFTMEKPDTTVEVKPGGEESSDTSENGPIMEFQAGDQNKNYDIQNSRKEIESPTNNDDVCDERDNMILTKNGGIGDERNNSIPTNGKILGCEEQTETNDASSIEEDVGEWRSVSGESEYPVHENVTDNEEEPRSVEEVIAEAEKLMKRGRRRGLALVDVDSIFCQAHAKLENLLTRVGDDDPVRSRVEGALGSCLVSWVKVDIANEEARSRLERAISLLERRIEQVKDDATALFNAGLCLCLFAATGKIEDARACYERACEFYERLLVVEPQSRIGFFNCGLAYISLGRIAVSAGDDAKLCEDIMKKAVARFEKSLELKPGDGKALSYLEESQKQLNSLQEV